MSRSRCLMCSQCPQTSVDFIVDPIFTEERIDGHMQFEYTCKNCDHYEIFLWNMDNPELYNRIMIAERLLNAQERELSKKDYHPTKGWGEWYQLRNGEWVFSTPDEIQF